MVYKKGTDFVLQGSTNTDWACDTARRCSTSRYCFNLGSATTSWCSKKQPTVAFSCREKKHIVVTMAAQECIWLKCLMGDIFSKVDYVVKVQCDNKTGIKHTSNPIFHGRKKHIEVHHNFIREKVLNKQIELDGVHTSA